MKKLSRDEMKNVMGGFMLATNSNCTYTMAPGFSAQGGSCSGKASQYKTAAHSWCWADDECLDVACR